MDHDAEMKELLAFKKEQQKRLAKSLGVSPEEVAKMRMYEIEQRAGLVKDRFDSPPYTDDPTGRIPPNFTEADRIRAANTIRRYLDSKQTG